MERELSTHKRHSWPTAAGPVHHSQGLRLSVVSARPPTLQRAPEVLLPWELEAPLRSQAGPVPPLNFPGLRGPEQSWALPEVTAQGGSGTPQTEGQLPPAPLPRRVCLCGMSAALAGYYGLWLAGVITWPRGCGWARPRSLRCPRAVTKDGHSQVPRAPRASDLEGRGPPTAGAGPGGSRGTWTPTSAGGMRAAGCVLKETCFSERVCT